MLEREDIERLKEIFVTRQECDKDMEIVNSKLGTDSTRLAVIETQLKTILWVLTAIGSGVITMIVKMFWG